MMMRIVRLSDEVVKLDVNDFISIWLPDIVMPVIEQTIILSHDNRHLINDGLGRSAMQEFCRLNSVIVEGDICYVLNAQFIE